MRIVQTFWTAGQDPLKHSFGWSHPQYNLMSWALSCLSLREHYDDVELYTDSAGYHILIEVLGLPYTKTHVVFDDFKCMPHHIPMNFMGLIHEVSVMRQGSFRLSMIRDATSPCRSSARTINRQGEAQQEVSDICAAVPSESEVRKVCMVSPRK